MNAAEPRVDAVTSQDGTPLHLQTLGRGNPVVVVHGSGVDHRSVLELQEELAATHAVTVYDRRGRGRSGDTAPYGVDREVDDLAAVARLAAAGSPELLVVGLSSGGALAVRAAAAGAVPGRVVVWEPPVAQHDGGEEPGVPGHVRQMEELLAQGRREDVAALFVTAMVRLPPAAVETVRGTPLWTGLVELAHTLPYDGRVVGGAVELLSTARNVRTPVLVLDGGTVGWATEAADALAAAIPGAQRGTLDGQRHDVEPAVLAVAVREFAAQP